MAHTMRAAAQSDPVPTLETVRPTMAKAGLDRTAPVKAGLHRTSESDSVGSSDQSGPAFIAVMKDAVVKHYGSVKAAAISLSVDPSLMTREFDAGKFGRLERADDEAKASIAEALYSAFGHADPRAKVQRLIREARTKLDELADVISQVA